MVKFVKGPKAEPSLTDVLMAMGSIRPNSMFLMTWPKDVPYPAKSFTAIAKVIGTTALRVKKTLQKGAE